MTERTNSIATAQSSWLCPVLDDKTGAIYNRVSSEQGFSLLPLKLVRKIGNGSNGDVLLMNSTEITSMYMAAKNFVLNSEDPRKNEERRRIFLRETALLQSVSHNNIINIYYSFLSPARGMILVNFCSRGTLYVANLKDEQVLKYFVNILDAVHHIHSKRIIHRDIKLDNILVENDDVLLTDFGLSKKLDNYSPFVSGVVGTLDYMAPEVYNSGGKSVYDGFKADSYSMGVYLWSLLARVEPYRDQDRFQLWPHLQTFKNFHSMDSTLKECARQLLVEDPRERADVTSLNYRLRRCGYIVG